MFDLQFLGHGRMFELSDDEIEFGQGIHGEAGYQRIKLKTANEMIEAMIKNISKALGLQQRDEVVVLVNNFGGLSQLEQGIVVHEVVKRLGMFFNFKNFTHEML